MKEKSPISNEDRIAILAGSLQGTRDSLDEIISAIDDAFDDASESIDDPKTKLSDEEKIEIFLEAINSARENIDGLISYIDDVCIEIDPR